MKISIALCCYDFPLSQGHTFLFFSFCVTKKETHTHTHTHTQNKTQCQAYLGRYKGTTNGCPEVNKHKPEPLLICIISCCY